MALQIEVLHRPFVDIGADTKAPAAVAPYAQPGLSVIVPTRNEAGNIEQLVGRLEQAMPDVALEIVFVDDSDDDTVAAIKATQEHARSRILLIHRPPGERTDGLGGAVVIGLANAGAPWACVMDADLQHPPELVPRLFAQAQEKNSDLVIASRFTQEGSIGSFGRMRAALSNVSSTAARVMFPGRLQNVSDPLSGFFLVRKATLPIDALRPHGFKILLEILVRTPNLRVSEVGFTFGERFAGKSKASLREGGRYLAHLCRLRFNDDALRFLRFLIIGLSGLLVNTLLLALATETLGIFYLWSAVLATQGSTLWNFALTETWVFSDRRAGQSRWARLVMFLVMNNAALLLRGPLMYLLTDRLGIFYILSNIISLGALMALRYTLADRLIWAQGAREKHLEGPFNYNIHGIVTVYSEVWLPELERFMTSMASPTPTIRVRIGNVTRARKQDATATGAARHLRYTESLGLLGFGMDITMGDTIDVLASPILRHSPHVLYTNVVEPILRWTFVEKGYALIHGACIAVGMDAYLVTARTDTGKTTTMLKILARQRRTVDRTAFLSDDLTLVSPNGRVLSYPKPLTISFHTVKAINSALLTRGEQLILPFQSRIHSRSGRRFAFLLTQTKLPVATINTIIQFLVPPPKYHVQRLVPSVKVTPEAQLAGMFVIQRGGEGNQILENAEALDILMTNCEDAYGFPPYPAIKEFLYGSTTSNLQQIERSIVQQALDPCPTTLLRSTTMDWAERISALVNLPTERREPVLEASGEAATVTA